MTTIITVKGRVTLPKKVRDAVGLKPGDKSR
jgi:AbrB family looped-hinge helix DNA binding protein